MRCPSTRWVRVSSTVSPSSAPSVWAVYCVPPVTSIFHQHLAHSSSLRMVPVAVSVAVTVTEVPETVRLTLNLSFASMSVSSVVATVKVFFSPAVPAKRSGAVFAV